MRPIISVVSLVRVVLIVSDAEFLISRIDDIVIVRRRTYPIV